jgi:hypothetical protein
VCVCCGLFDLSPENRLQLMRTSIEVSMKHKKLFEQLCQPKASEWPSKALLLVVIKFLRTLSHQSCTTCTRLDKMLFARIIVVRAIT